MTRFQMTQDHIDRGLKRDEDQCPVALCIGERLKPRFVASAAWDYVLVYEIGFPDPVWHTQAPGHVVEFEDRFDHDCDPAPIDFELDIPGVFLKEEV